MRYFKWKFKTQECLFIIYGSTVIIINFNFSILFYFGYDPQTIDWESRITDFKKMYDNINF